MTIPGVGPAGQIPVPGLPNERTDPKEVRSQQGPPNEAPAPPPSLGLAALAPPGTDPTLWSVLTAEERAYFEQVQALGPVTYGPGSSVGDSAAPRGSRIDVKV